jgi:hypothetical protein
MAAGSQAQGSWQNAKGSQIPAKSDFSELSSTEPDASATGSLLKNRVSHPYHATLHNLRSQAPTMHQPRQDFLLPRQSY